MCSAIRKIMAPLNAKHGMLGRHLIAMMAAIRMPHIAKNHGAM
jgi:hypothetical protein